MHWKRKGDVSEHYCAAHNVDCPYHGAGRDQMVLSLAPNKMPEPWVCPAAVLEMARHADDARRYEDQGGGSDFVF